MFQYEVEKTYMDQLQPGHYFRWAGQLLVVRDVIPVKRPGKVMLDVQRPMGDRGRFMFNKMRQVEVLNV